MTAKKNPRILIVTPEITYLPRGMGNMSNMLRAKAGGLADVSASLVAALFKQGADVHVTLPHYRKMFNIDVGKLISNELRVYTTVLPDSQVHLAEDRAFYYRDQVYSNYHSDSIRHALAFQREVINNIIPLVKPDLIHCNDWMTGLVPAYARRLGVPCLFTVHNIHTQNITMDTIEDRGIDAAEFWENLYFSRTPYNYEESRQTNPVDLLTTGIFAAHYINTVSPTFLKEMVDGMHSFIPQPTRNEIRGKYHANCAAGILNAPDADFNPAIDKHLAARFTADNMREGKIANKLLFQRKAGLIPDPDAPLFFWPSRLDPVQKGCQLLSDILYRVVSDYWQDNLQIAFVANGNYQQVFHDIVEFHELHNRVAVCDFDDTFSHLGYAASDFTLMPSRFEPCGLPQMVCQYYGSLPLAHDTGGLHDTVEDLNMDINTGNGFLFKDYDTGGLRWAFDQAMRFHKLPWEAKERQLSRIMTEAAKRFNHHVTARAYIDIYEHMLHKPLVNR
jgi:ADP-glucose type glycogen/starch synthase